MSLDDAIKEAIDERIRPLAERLEAAIAKLEGKAGSEYLSVKAAAATAGVNPATVRGWIRDGKLKQHGPGRVLRIRRSDLDAFLSSPEPRETPAPEPEAEALAIMRRRQ